MYILDWEYYSSHFPKLNEDEFKSLNYYATMLVLKQINKSYAEMTEDEQTAVKDCICNVLNLLIDYEKSSAVASVSNDGYSVSYRESKEENKQTSLNQIYDTWLGGLRIARFICF